MGSGEKEGRGLGGDGEQKVGCGGKRVLGVRAGRRAKQNKDCFIAIQKII